MITDPIGDLITRLRNARVGDHSVEVKNSNENRAILKLLFAEGWINGWVSKKSAAQKSVAPLEQKGSTSSETRLLTVLMKDKSIDGSYGYGKNGGGRKSYDSSSIYGKLIGSIHRVSKPGRRVYVKKSELPEVTRDGLTTYVLSTPQGIITSVEARKLNVGGEVLFYVTT
jgi:small subunit ribosomal protein S8